MPSSKARAIAEELKPSFEEILRRTYSASSRLATRIVGDAEGAADVLQDAYLNVFRSFERFRGESKYETWVYRIVVNAAMGHLKRLNRQRTREVHVDIMKREPEDVAASSAVEDLAISVDLVKLLASLSEGDRSLLVMRYALGYSVRQISEECGTSESNVKVRLYRARKRLADLAGLELAGHSSLL